MDIWQNDYIKFDQIIILPIKECNCDNDETDPLEEYFRKKKKDNNDDTYFPPKNQNQQIIKNIRKSVERFFKIKKLKK